MVKLSVLETEKPNESLIIGRGAKTFAYRFRPYSRWPRGPRFKVFSTIAGAEISVDECHVNDYGEVFFRVKGDVTDAMAFVKDWIEREGWKVEGGDKNMSEVKWKKAVCPKGAICEVVEMSPLDFLSKVPSPCREGRTALEDLKFKDCWSGSSIRYIWERIGRGEELDPPFIDYNRMFRGFPTHEGRHRAFVAYKMGVEKIPVLVLGKATSQEESLAARKWQLRVKAERLLKEIREEKARIGV